MKKLSYPPRGEIEMVIAELMRRRGLRDELKRKTTAVVKAEQELRRELCGYLFVADENHRPLSEYIARYRRSNVPKDGDISRAIAQLEQSQEELVKEQEALKDRETELLGTARALCARTEGVKRAEYEALIAEIAAVLLPFCDGDEDAARSLAAETPAASKIQAERQRCYPSLYSGPADDLISPLRAVLELATAKTR